MDSNSAPPATAPTAAPPLPADTAPRRRRLLWPWLLLALLVAVGIWQYPAVKAQAEAGSAYAARIGCSCRYVQGRAMDSCVTDFEPGMEFVSVADDTETKTVTGSVPLLASRSARFSGPNGCILDPAD